MYKFKQQQNIPQQSNRQKIPDDQHLHFFRLHTSEFLLKLAVAITILTSFPPQAYAQNFGQSDIVQTCDCLPISSAREALRNATMVFSGQVLEKTRISVSSVAEDYKEFHIKFIVQKYWKGTLGKTVKVRTPAQGAWCGFEFRKGQSYLVYATADPVPLVTVCSRTTLLKSSRAESDVRRLGEGKYP